MGETTRKRVRETLRRAKEVRIWFWDGQREYNGTAQEISATGFAGSFLATDPSQKAVHLSVTMLQLVSRQITSRPMEFRIQAMGSELNVKGQVINVDRSQQNPDWLLISGELTPGRDSDRATLNRFGESIPK